MTRSRADAIQALLCAVALFGFLGYALSWAWAGVIVSGLCFLDAAIGSRM